MDKQPNISNDPLPRKKFKNKGLLFDETEYRKDFYSIVFETQPLFKDLSEFTFTQPDSSQPNDDTYQRVFCSKVKAFIKDRLASRLAQLQQNESYDNNAIQQRILSYKEGFKSLRRFIERLNDSSKRDLLESYFNVPELNVALHQYLAKIYYFLNIASLKEDLCTYYDVDEKECLFQLISGDHNPEKLLESVTFNEDRYQNDLTESALTKFLKAKKVFQRQWGQNLHLLLDKLSDSELEELINNAFRAERSLRLSLFTRNELNLHVENIFEKIQGELKRVIEENKGLVLKNLEESDKRRQDIEAITAKEKKYEQICLFNESKTKNFMSSQSVSEYEVYMDEYVRLFSRLLDNENEEKLIIHLLQQVTPHSQVGGRETSLTYITQKAVTDHLIQVQRSYSNLRNARNFDLIIKESGILVDEMEIEMLENQSVSHEIIEMKTEPIAPSRRKFLLALDQGELFTRNDHKELVELSKNRSKAEIRTFISVDDSEIRGSVGEFVEFLQLVEYEGKTLVKSRIERVIISILTAMRFQGSPNEQQILKLEINDLKLFIEQISANCPQKIQFPDTMRKPQINPRPEIKEVDKLIVNEQPVKEKNIDLIEKAQILQQNEMRKKSKRALEGKQDDNLMKSERKADFMKKESKNMDSVIEENQIQSRDKQYEESKIELKKKQGDDLKGSFKTKEVRIRPKGEQYEDCEESKMKPEEIVGRNRQEYFIIINLLLINDVLS